MKKTNRLTRYLVYLIKKFLYIAGKLFGKDWINDKMYLKIRFYYKMNRKLNLKNPKTFNEKMQWLKLYDRKEEYSQMVDKYETKKYVGNAIGEQYIIPTLGVFEKFEDIDFEKLPDKFVIKCTHNSGKVFVCEDKKRFEIEKCKAEINKELERNYYFASREWVYKDVKPRIIIEKCMTTETQKELIDYKFFCFNGKPEFLYVSQGWQKHNNVRVSFVDMDYNELEFYRIDYKPFEKLPQKPVNFEEMKILAQKLSKDIPFVRVDLYEIDNKVYFSELTFYPCAGYLPFYPKKYDEIIGDMLELPINKNEGKNDR